MKLASIYSNQEDVFPTITFNAGFNVIFARVKDPTAKGKDSHNLGKTFLITVLDFLLLAEIDAEHPFRKRKEVFEGLVLFLEIETHTGQFVTVRREIETKSLINLEVSDQRHQNLAFQEHADWTLRSLSVEKARQKLNSLLHLETIEPEDYRKGLSYVMRRQSDYHDVFKTSKFAKGSDKYWKPFVTQLLGFPRDLIVKKYATDSQISDLEARRKVFEQEAGSNNEAYDEIRGLIQIKETEAQRSRDRLDTFSFREVEAEINDRLVDDIEVAISSLNRRRYSLDYELREIDKSLRTKIKFDLETIQRLFNEAQIELPSSLVRSYSEVIEFNTKMSSHRSERLRQTREKLSSDRVLLQDQLDQLDARRTEALSLLEQKETLVKYRAMQQLVSAKETEILTLRHQLAQLDKAAILQAETETVKQELGELVKQIREAIRGNNATYSNIRAAFSNCVDTVLNVQALMVVTVNQSGNIDFNVRTLDSNSEGRETSESLGTSYKKVLCACFDLALMQVYSGVPFYHFVYHDGVFEGLDNRKKVNLLNLIRSACEIYGIQYILTVIDSDLPRDDRDNKEMFREDDIVRELHDLDYTGRLFRTSAF